MQKVLIAIICLTTFSFTSKSAEAHCEVPCGIYNDSVRVKLIYEHIMTIEKAMNQINKESNSAKPNYNQLVRWINNKESHATKIQNIVSQYFLHQRIKTVGRTDRHAYSHYIEKLELLHKLSVYAMKAKQGTDVDYIKQMRSTLATFEKVYFSHSH